jgi:chromosome segregation ATPase
MRRLIPYFLLIPAVIAAGFWWRAEQDRRLAWSRVAQLEGQSKAPAAEPASPPETAEEPVAAASQTRVVRVPTGTDPAPYLKTIDELRDQLKEQSKALSAARDAAARAEAALSAQDGESKKLRSQMDDLREDIQAARRVGEALQAELQAKSDRLVKVETSEKLMQDRLARAESAATKVAGVSKEVEDINRRREAFLTTLLRRYREVSDLYRNFTLNVQTRETPGAGLQAGDLSRIQTAIQQAEDDLRQLQALNARMAQLARAK